jgi:UDP-glucose 4-epimerase
MRVLVTGGLGFVGKAVTRELLGSGAEVVVLRRVAQDAGTAAADLAGVRVVACDLRDAPGIARIVRDDSFDGDGIAQPAFVFASSAHVYGSRRDGVVAEDAEPAPESTYAHSKLSAEQMVTEHARALDAPAVILRIFNVGGAVAGTTDTDRTRIIPALLDAAHRQTRVPLNGDATRDFVHVLDVASAVRAALERTQDGGECPVYNVASGVGSSLVDVVDCVREVTGRAIDVEHVPSAGLVDRLVADVTRARKELDWEPVHSNLRTIVTDAWAAWPGRS